MVTPALPYRLLQLPERVEHVNVRAILAQVTDLMKWGTTAVLLDCHRVTFMDSSGLGLLVTILNRLEADGGHLYLCGVREHTLELLEATDLQQTIPIFEHEAAFCHWLTHAQPNQQLAIPDFSGTIEK
ncbi:STAS domain-containing protein [Neosynechococcus sphagnicola]|uniref:STAS domain-containing protein n=1 Tax=Neosynechococcus sphagnicola TaxID=1501145 RepID=UPI00068CA241|nr:STAS domain-containing protein [Neosynechococcus sphagnicola]